MNKQFLVAAMLTLSTIMASAQAGSSVNLDSLKSRQAEIKSRLQLTADQEPKWDQLHQAYFGELRALKNDESSRREKFKTFQRVKKDHQKKVQNLLTPQQYQIYEKEMAETRASLKQKQKARQ